MDYTHIDAWVMQAKQGDRAAAGHLAQAFRPKIEHLARRLFDANAHEDAVQELNLALLQAIKRYDAACQIPFNAYVSSYLNRTFRKLIDPTHREYAGRSVQADVSFDALETDDSQSLKDQVADPSPGVEARVLAKERTRRLKDWVNSLPPMQRKVIIEHYVKGRSLRSIARETGLNLQTIQTHHKRALACYVDEDA